MPQIIPLLILKFFCMWMKESTPHGCVGFSQNDWIHFGQFGRCLVILKIFGGFNCESCVFFLDKGFHVPHCARSLDCGENKTLGNTQGRLKM